ncbi:exonuclease SbcCD subunit D [Leptothrix ochracea]
MVRLLHSADWQIGRAYLSRFLPENGHALAEARLQAVERLAALATAQSVDMVIVAGDVFDAQTVTDRTIRRLFNALAGFAGPWILLPGNHDAALAESVWTRAQRLGAVPAKVHLALKPEVLLFPELGLALLPAPLTQRHSYGDLSAWFDTAETPDGWLRVGMAHGGVQGLLMEGLDATNPLAPDRAERARLDYLALGDWHGCKRIDERTWYSGTPEPDRFKANDAGQALLVELNVPGAVPQVTPVRTAQFHWQRLEAVLQVATDVDALIAQLAALGPSDVVDLSIRGQIDGAGESRLNIALNQAEARLRHLGVDRSALRLALSDDDMATYTESLHADGYLAEVMAELCEAQRQEGLSAQTAQDALALLLSVLAETASL